MAHIVLIDPHNEYGRVFGEAAVMKLESPVPAISSPMHSSTMRFRPKTSTSPVRKGPVYAEQDDIDRDRAGDGADIPPGFRNWPVHSPPQRLLDLPDLGAHAVAT